MALDADTLMRVAHLARLRVSEEELAAYEHSLNAILGLVDQLQSVDTQNIEAMAHPLAVTQSLRPDEVTEQDHHQDYQRLAPAVEAGLYLVPRVIE